jgi:hypothetical protein
VIPSLSTSSAWRFSAHTAESHLSGEVLGEPVLGSLSSPSSLVPRIPAEALDIALGTGG